MSDRIPDFRRYKLSFSGNQSFPAGTGALITSSSPARLVYFQNVPGQAGNMVVGNVNTVLNAQDGIVLVPGQFILFYCDNLGDVGVFNSGAGVQLIQFAGFL